ncbi:hypothetical protein BKA56DRAFT_609794 [Ilyonectria sp. MPI-CAGE-AT-0026]|nr:hypothetical protein BKA56DRAFT_609794 [Ilyonectria sp. MPI-CAGE-AT-0026]
MALPSDRRRRAVTETSAYVQPSISDRCVYAPNQPNRAQRADSVRDVSLDTGVEGAGKAARVQGAERACGRAETWWWVMASRCREVETQPAIHGETSATLQRDFPQAHTHAHAHAHTHKARVGHDRTVSSARIPDGPGGTVPLPSLHRSITSSLHHFITSSPPHRRITQAVSLPPHVLCSLIDSPGWIPLGADKVSMRNNEQSRARHRSASGDQATPPFIPLCLLARVTGLHRPLPGFVRLPDCVHDHPLVLCNSASAVVQTQAADIPAPLLHSVAALPGGAGEAGNLDVAS